LFFLHSEKLPTCHGIGKLKLGRVIPFFRHVEALEAVWRYLEIMDGRWILSCIKGVPYIVFVIYHLTEKEIATYL